METFHTALRWSHVIAGGVGLIVYWIAALTKKGGKTHKRAGRWFVNIVYYVTGTALFATLWGTLFPVSYVHAEALSAERVDSIRFFVAILMFLATLTLSAAYLGTRALRTRTEPSRLGSPLLYGVFGIQIISACWLAWVGYQDMNRYAGQRHWICFGLAGLGLFDAGQQLFYIRRQASGHMAWFLKHVECMVGCGAAFHTAAAVTIARVVNLQLPGMLQLVPWVLPSVVAIATGSVLKKKYRRKFKLDEMQEPTATEPAAM